MKNFINKPISHLLCYKILLKSMMEDTLPRHEDLDLIPKVIGIIKVLGKETEPGVLEAKQKVRQLRFG